MRWSEASLSPGEPLHLTGWGEGRQGASSRYEGEEAIVIQRAKKKKNKKTNGEKERSLLGLLHLDTATVEDK